MGASDKKITIAITGLNANENPGAGVGVARALRAYYGDRVKIIGLAYESLEPGIYLKDVTDRTYQIPYPAAGTAVLQQRLEQIHQQEQLNLIIPNFDAELLNFILLAPYLKSIGIETFLPTAEQLQNRDKINLKAFGEKHGFNIPESIGVNSVNDLAAAIERLSYPLVIKGKYYEAVVARTKDAATQAFYHLSSKWGLPVITQKFISGTEINVAGLGDGNGNTISAVPMRKLYITDKGKAWAGITIADEELIQLAVQFTATLNWKGGFELELVKDTEGKLYVLEINPRFPAWVFLTLAAGQNQPAALANMALGEHIEPFNNLVSGKMFIRYSWDEVVDVEQFQLFSAFGQLPS